MCLQTIIEFIKNLFNPTPTPTPHPDPTPEPLPDPNPQEPPQPPPEPEPEPEQYDITILPQSPLSASDYEGALESFKIMQQDWRWIIKWWNREVTVSIKGNLPEQHKEFIANVFECFNSLQTETRYRLILGNANFNITYIENDEQFHAYMEQHNFWFNMWANYACTFNYGGEIYRTEICLVPNGDNCAVVQSIILHEIFHGLGFAFHVDTNLNWDSIIGSDIGKNPVGLSKVDLLAYLMLYSKDVKTGSHYDMLKKHYDQKGVNHLLTF